MSTHRGCSSSTGEEMGTAAAADLQQLAVKTRQAPQLDPGLACGHHTTQTKIMHHFFLASKASLRMQSNQQKTAPYLTEQMLQPLCFTVTTGEALSTMLRTCSIVDGASMQQERMGPCSRSRDC